MTSGITAPPPHTLRGIATRAYHFRNALPRPVVYAKARDAPNIRFVQGQRSIWLDESEPRRQEKGTPNEPVIRDPTTDRYVQATCRHRSPPLFSQLLLGPTCVPHHEKKPPVRWRA